MKLRSNYHLQDCDGAPAEEGGEPIEPVEVYEALEGHGNRATATRRLAAAGYETEEDLRQANPQDLMAIYGIAKGTVSYLCRNLDNPWVTPFKHGPNPPEDWEDMTPAPETCEEPIGGPTDKANESEEEDEGRGTGNDTSVKVCPFCSVIVPEKKYAVHICQCDEA